MPPARHHGSARCGGAPRPREAALPGSPGWHGQGAPGRQNHCVHGPVVPEVYQKYKEHGGEALPSPEPGTVDFSRYSEDEKETLDEIYRVFGQFSAWRLREMTHSEAPWVENFREGETHIVIPRETMKRYFKTQLESE